MKNTNRQLRSMILKVFLFIIVAGTSQLAMAQQPRTSLEALTRALAEAGAPALTPQQSDRITSLVDAFRAARRQQTPTTTVPTARRTYDEAIIAGDSATAQAQAAIIADQIATTTKANLTAEATFKIQVLGVLTADQTSALLKRFGTGGVSGVLSRLAGGEGPGQGPGRERLGPMPGRAMTPIGEQ